MELTLTRGDGPIGPSPLTQAPIRVAFCIDGMGVGGTEMNAVRTAERLDRDRYVVSVVAMNADGPIRARYDAAGIPVASFPISSLYGPSALRQGLALRRYLREQRIDVVHCHDMYSNAFVVPWARSVGVEGVITSRRWELFAGPALAMANRLAYRMSDVVLANSPWVARLVRTETALGADRVRVVPNFVEDAALDPMSASVRAHLRRSLGLPDDALVVGVIANLTPVKDHATLLRAFGRAAAARPAARLVLVGDGPCRTSLQTLASTLGIADRVHFAGARPHLPNLHHLFDLSALSSTSEGFPNSIVEAMAAGNAVVATRVGGVADAVEDGRTGLLVPSGDDAAFADALGALLDDAPRRRAMGARAYSLARESYTAGSALNALGAIYDQLVARAAARGRR